MQSARIRLTSDVIRTIRAVNDEIYSLLPFCAADAVSRIFSSLRTARLSMASLLRLWSTPVSKSSGGTGEGLPFSPMATNVR